MRPFRAIHVRAVKYRIKRPGPHWYETEFGELCCWQCDQQIEVETNKNWVPLKARCKCGASGFVEVSGKGADL
jgi:hypothetical protein